MYATGGIIQERDVAQKDRAFGWIGRTGGCGTDTNSAIAQAEVSVVRICNLGDNIVVKPSHQRMSHPPGRICLFNSQNYPYQTDPSVTCGS